MRPWCSPTSNTVVTFGCDSAMSERARSISDARLAASGVKSGGQKPHRDGPAEARVARPEQLARARRLEPFEQVVMRNDADRRRSGVAHPALSSSMTLWSSSFASPICSTTSAMSSVGLARVSACSGNTRHAGPPSRARRSADRAPPPGAPSPSPSSSREPRARRGASRMRTSGYPFLGGCEGRISMRLGRLRAGNAIRSATACATSSGASFH